jgi:hypothetical protein
VRGGAGVHFSTKAEGNWSEIVGRGGGTSGN